MAWDNLEEAFKDLDQKEFAVVASTLAALRDSLMQQGFTRRETLRLVESYSKFLFDMSIEAFVAEKRQEADDRLDHELEQYMDEEGEDFEDDDVDSYEDDE